MVAPIDAISSQPMPVSPAPVKGPSAPAHEPDLRETQNGVKALEEASKPPEARVPTEPEKELEAAINDRLARLLRSNIRLRIERDEGSGNFVYKSIDKKTGEVDRQWPAETVLRMLAFFRELDGLLFDKEA